MSSDLCVSPLHCEPCRPATCLNVLHHLLGKLVR